MGVLREGVRKGRPGVGGGLHDGDRGRGISGVHRVHKGDNDENRF